MAYVPFGYRRIATGTIAAGEAERQPGLRDLLTEAAEHRRRGDHAAAQFIEGMALVAVRHG